MPRLHLALLPLALCVTLTACGRLEEPMSSVSGRSETAAAAAAMAAKRMAPATADAAEAPAPDGAGAVAPQQYLAFEHTVQIDVPTDRMAAAHQSAVTACQQLMAEQCVVLESNLNTGETTAGATLKFRARPEGIAKLKATLGSQGTVTDQSTTAEDLASPIEDATRRLAMLGDYRAKLEALSNRSSNDVEALMKVAKELAQVQSEIEGLSGEKAHLVQRVNTQILNVGLHARGNDTLWQPITRTLSSFGRNLAEGTAAAITAVAFALPWVVLGLLVMLGVRKVRRRSQAKRP